MCHVMSDAVGPELEALLRELAASCNGTAGTSGRGSGSSSSSPSGLPPQVLLLHLNTALAKKDYTAALEALHRHFDYAQVGGWLAGCLGGVGKGKSPGGGESADAGSSTSVT